MKLIDELPNPGGLCVLTAQGDIGFYDADRSMQVDPALSATLREHSREFLRHYLQDPDCEDCRVAIIFDASKPQPWGKTTFYFDEAVIRKLYPTGGRAVEALTAFQKRCREKSVYQGMELLLEYRSDTASNAPAFCPVLFDRHTTLGDYEARLGRALSDEERRQPVIEVVNLIAPVMQARRESPVYVELKDRLYRGLIRKEQRRHSALGIVDRDAIARPDRAAPIEAFTGIDKRCDRVVTLTAKDIDSLHQTERYERVERWLEIPYRPVEPGRLTGFVHFRDLDPARLGLVAARALVYTAPPGTCLLEQGMTDQWNLFLLEGCASLTPKEGAVVLVEGGTDKAASPLAFLKPRKYTVTAVSHVSFLWIHDALLQVVQNSGRHAAATGEADGHGRLSIKPSGLRIAS